MRSNDISSKGFAWGYMGGVISIILCTPWGFVLPEIPAYELAMVICGVWWACGMYPAWRWLLPRPGPPLPVGTTYWKEGLRSVQQTYRDVVSLPMSARFLIWWMVGSDAIFLIGNIGGLFANSEVTW